MGYAILTKDITPHYFGGPIFVKTYSNYAEIIITFLP